MARPSSRRKSSIGEWILVKVSAGCHQSPHGTRALDEGLTRKMAVREAHLSASRASRSVGSILEFWLFPGLFDPAPATGGASSSRPLV